MKKFILALIFIFQTTASYAVTAWVDNNGAASWGSCQGATPLSGASACSLGTANTNASAGDIINMRTGTYTTVIVPTNSGTAGNYITYQAYNSEVATVTTTTYGANLAGKRYIKLDGIRIVNTVSYWVYMYHTYANRIDSYNIIQNCYMEGTKAWAGIIMFYSNYNKILNNEFKGTCPCATACSESDGGPNDTIYIKPGNYNLVQGNTISYAPHIGINLYGGQYNVIKNNTISNPWHSGVAVVETNSATTGEAITLVEGNTILDAGRDAATNYCGSVRDREDFDPWEHAGIQLGSPENIARNNVIINCGTITMNTYATEGRYCLSNRVYNNTFYENYRAVSNVSSQTASDNILKNNIIYGSREYSLWFSSTSDGGFSFTNSNITGSRNFSGTYTNNVAVDPLFVNQSSRNLHLTSGSPMINTGAWLTTITTSTGSGTSFTVADGRYFTDGWGIVDGDDIQLEGDASTTRITNINGNVITVTPSVSWTQGDGVSLAYVGSDPDIGAYEYTGDVTPPTLEPVTITADGSTWEITFSETPTIGSGGSAGWAVVMTTAGAVTLTFDHITGLVAYYNGSPEVLPDDTIVSGSYTQPGNGIEDVYGNDFATVADFTSIFTNLSAYVYVDHRQQIIHNTNGQQLKYDSHGQNTN